MGMPLKSDIESTEMQVFLSSNGNFEELKDVFFHEVTGLLTNPDYGEEAKQLKFSCHSYRGFAGARTFCCPSRCTNCEAIDMNDGKMDSKYTDSMKEDIMQKCNP